MASLIDNVTYRSTINFTNACSSVPVVQFFRVNTACKTDGNETPTGIESEDIDISTIRVFPIPTSQELNVWFTTNEEESIQLFDLQGRLQIVDVSFEAKGKAKLNVSNLSKGVYILEINNGSKITKRIVID